MNKLMNGRKGQHYSDLMTELEKWNEEDNLAVLAKFEMLKDKDVKEANIITKKSMLLGFEKFFGVKND